MTLVEFAFAKKRVYEKHAPRFQQVFGVHLMRFWDHINGFDVVKFDEEFVKPAKGVSTRQAVEERWGKDAVELVLTLIG